MSEPDKKESKSKDSFDVPVQKSPLMIYALLQIPIVIIMVIIIYFMYQARQGN